MAADASPTGSSDLAGRDASPSTPERADLVELMRELAALRDAQQLSEAEYELARGMAVAARRPPAEPR